MRRCVFSVVMRSYPDLVGGPSLLSASGFCTSFVLPGGRGGKRAREVLVNTIAFGSAFFFFFSSSSFFYKPFRLLFFCPVVTYTSYPLITISSSFALQKNPGPPGEPFWGSIFFPRAFRVHVGFWLLSSFSFPILISRRLQLDARRSDTLVT
jgi:hypothetical protein